MTMSHVLLIQCPDRPGLIHTVTGVLLGHGVNIVSNDEFVDPQSGRFFMRTEFTGDASEPALIAELQRALPENAQVRLAGSNPKAIVLFAGKEPHCLADLLLRQHIGELNVVIRAVVSNHPTLRPLVEKFAVPFFHLPCEADDRLEHEQRILAVLQGFAPEFIILAKYMRVLTPSFIAHYPQRIINVHHSFLPAFIGAQPYRQAYNRGVKIIGATAHFVTDQLDDGPIITQNVLPVTHAHTAQSMAQEGREIEKIVLARALLLLTEDRVFISGNKTIIFE
jgi:formyltetrahydrofolate deformylase